MGAGGGVILPLILPSSPSPSRGGIKGGGVFGPNVYRGSPHPLPASPVEGEVLFGGCGGIA